MCGERCGARCGVRVAPTAMGYSLENRKFADRDTAPSIEHAIRQGFCSLLGPFDRRESLLGSSLVSAAPCLVGASRVLVITTPPLDHKRARWSTHHLVLDPLTLRTGKNVDWEVCKC